MERQEREPLTAQGIGGDGGRGEQRRCPPRPQRVENGLIEQRPEQAGRVIVAAMAAGGKGGEIAREAQCPRERAAGAVDRRRRTRGGRDDAFVAAVAGADAGEMRAGLGNVRLAAAARGFICRDKFR